VSADITFSRPAENPFASRRIEGLAYQSPGFSWRRLENRLDDLDRRCAVVGPKGSGKTTLLEAIAQRLDPPIAMVRMPGSCIHPWRTACAQLPQRLTDRHAVLVDGCEQLGVVGWRRLLHATRRTRALIVTLHKPGRLPTLIRCRTDRQLLSDLVGQLAPELDANLDQLFHRHKGNLRSCFGELYDVCAGRT
jgi:hypothetical protein